MRNIEIKAQIRNIGSTSSKIEDLSDITGRRVIKQRDIFFNATRGRLKLRRFEDGSAELISYERPDVLGPRLSSYDKVTLDSDTAESLTNILSHSIGVFGTVNKTRQLYMVGQTRVHVDEVDGLGTFMELEVVLQEDQDIEAGQKIAADLMEALLIKQEDLIAEAYVDLLKKTKTSV
ncbi:hypothetical protein DMN91_009368 [Ooceraea biroi]|uniref:CYTH domain-containing protein n=1 Tax=Ooceraea biroi TaxID=2015173 RepID=A0A3L8DEV8_OOCBI|nr:uncharacterized protein LOC105284727 [Ooceraea biroi]XP_026828206.1 uncharacterized protein LOC105284727 [Ooceraea biroi]XP_026828207.1 uncharacterized protein LOC105284727 [Ooceraea biroi]RLU19010.1 hypothetical protein DMN91_009368 [Ooceraea biroi]